MPGREYTAQSVAGYRFGFNGKERDDETYGEGDVTDFGDRIYDGRIGRWLSIDPFFKKYASSSPYIGCANNPIALIDKGGDSTAYYSETGIFLGKAYDSRIDAIVVVSEADIIKFTDKFNGVNFEKMSTDEINLFSDDLRKLGTAYEVSLFTMMMKTSLSKNNEDVSKLGNTEIRHTDKNGILLHKEIEYYLGVKDNKIILIGKPTKGTAFGVNPDKNRAGVFATAHTHPNGDIRSAIRTVITTIIKEGPFGPYEYHATKITNITIPAKEGPSQGTPTDPGGDIDNSQAKPGYLSVVVAKKGLYFYNKKGTQFKFTNFKHAK
jgi:RHS repeat-associated protein